MEVHIHTEWINCIMPVVKSDGSLRLCLNLKDMNKAIEQNQWKCRTLDDILPWLSPSKYFTLDDANSTFWLITLDLQSSLLTFNIPLGKFRWLRLPFVLKLSSDAFSRDTRQSLKAIGRCLRNSRWHPHTYDILIHDKNEVENDGRLLALFETARLNNLNLNLRKMQFKTRDCKFSDPDSHHKASNQIQTTFRQF